MQNNPVTLPSFQPWCGSPVPSGGHQQFNQQGYAWMPAADFMTFSYDALQLPTSSIIIILNWKGENFVYKCSPCQKYFHCLPSQRFTVLWVSAHRSPSPKSPLKYPRLSQKARGLPPLLVLVTLPGQSPTPALLTVSCHSLAVGLFPSTLDQELPQPFIFWCVPSIAQEQARPIGDPQW